MEMETRWEGRATVVSLSGSIDSLGGPEASVYLLRTIENGSRHLVLDMSDVTFISSAGIQMIVNTIKMVRQAGGDLHLAAVPTSVRKVMELGGLLDAVDSFQDVAAAAAAFGG